MILVGHPPAAFEDELRGSRWSALVAQVLPRPDLVLEPEAGASPTEAESSPPRPVPVERLPLVDLEESTLRREAVARVWCALQSSRRRPALP